MKRIVVFLFALLFAVGLCAFADTGPLLQPATLASFHAGDVTVAPEMLQLASIQAIRPVPAETTAPPAVRHWEMNALLMMIAALFILMAMIALNALLKRWASAGHLARAAPRRLAGHG